MFTKRFLFLAAVLVVLNTALWLTPEGLALRRIALPQLYGKNLMRAEVKLKSGADWRVDRGVINAVSLTQVTLKEADTHVQTIGISTATKVISGGGDVLPLAALTKGWQVLVTWPANGPADTIKVEKRGKGKGGGDLRR